MGMTDTQQRNAVSEGMALGLLMCGRNELDQNKVTIDLAFQGAWRIWGYADRFPRVTTDLRQGLDPIYVITRATERKNVWNLYWEASGRTLSVYARPQWQEIEIDADEIAESVGGDIPSSGWKALASDLLDRLADK